MQYEVCTARYNYTRRDGTTNAGTLLSRNGTKIGTVHDFSLYRTARLSAGGACIRRKYHFNKNVRYCRVHTKMIFKNLVDIYSPANTLWIAWFTDDVCSCKSAYYGAYGGEKNYIAALVKKKIIFGSVFFRKVCVQKGNSNQSII